MNERVEEVSKKIKEKYQERVFQNESDKHITQKIVLPYNQFYKKPEDLRSRSGSKIGCGITKAFSAQKTTNVKTKMNVSSEKQYLNKNVKPAMS